MFSAPFLSTLLDRVKAVVRRVARPGAELVPTAPEAQAAVSPVLRGIARDWMRSMLRALSALTRRVEAGEPAAVLVREALAGARADAAAVRDAAAAGVCLPRGFGWICTIDPRAREAGAAFAAWLGEPAMRAQTMAAPEAMALVLGPILDAVGAERPEWLAVVPEGGNSISPVCEPRSGLSLRSRPIREDGDVAGDRQVKPGDECCFVAMNARKASGARVPRARGRKNVSCSQQLVVAQGPPRRFAHRGGPVQRAFSKMRRNFPRGKGVLYLLRYQNERPPACCSHWHLPFQKGRHPASRHAHRASHEHAFQARRPMDGGDAEIPRRPQKAQIAAEETV
jgi:hypothetical protein